MLLDLMKIFDDFISAYHTFKLANFHLNGTFTLKELNYFFDLGHKMGYEAFTEDTAVKVRPMDLSWWDDFHDGKWNELILHLERENTWGKKNPLKPKDEETLDKLFQKDRLYPPSNVIGMISVPSQERINELLAQTQQRCNVDNALLIFRVNPRAVGGITLEAYLLAKGQVVKHKTAYVLEDPNTEYLFLTFTPPR